jgi:hypothetical protein
MKRPFSISLGIADQEEVLNLKIDFKRALSSDQMTGFAEILDVFRALAVSGALCGEQLDPTTTGLILKEKRIDVATATWIFHQVRLDPAALCILLNLLHWGHIHLSPIQDVYISWAAISQLSHPLTIQFPRLRAPCPFQLEMGDLPDEFDIQIELSAAQSEATIESINEAMGAWFCAANWGAYADDNFDPSKSTIYFTDEVMELSEKEITWFIDVFRCNFGALDGLVNLLERTHYLVSPIRSVRIGLLEDSLS